MAVIDIIILILLLLAVIKGLKDGLIRQAGGIREFDTLRK